MKTLTVTIDEIRCIISGSKGNGIKVKIDGDKAVFKDIKGKPVLDKGKVPLEILERLINLINIYFYGK